MEQYVTEKYVLKRIVISHATLWRWISSGEFPQPERKGKRTSRWKQAVVDTWDENHGIECGARVNLAPK